MSGDPVDHAPDINDVIAARVPAVVDPQRRRRMLSESDAAHYTGSEPSLNIALLRSAPAPRGLRSYQRSSTIRRCATFTSLR
jgi:hypothetical protein